MLAAGRLRNFWLTGLVSRVVGWLAVWPCLVPATACVTGLNQTLVYFARWRVGHGVSLLEGKWAKLTFGIGWALNIAQL